MNELSRRKFMYLTGGTGAALGLAACSGSTATSAGSTATSGGEAALSMWSHEGDLAKYFDTRAATLSAVAGAQYKYKPLALTVQPLNDIVAKLFSAFSAKKDIPDIVAIEINAFSKYMANNVAGTVLEDLTPLLGADVGGLYNVAATKPYTLNGKIYGIGNAFDLLGYYYREDLMKQLGIQLPIDTWENVLEIGRKVAKPHGKYMSTLAVSKGGVATTGISSQFVYWLLQRGGAIFDTDGKTVTLDSPESVDVLTFMYTALKDDVFLGVDALWGPAEVAAIKSGTVIAHEGADWWRFMITRNLTDQFGKWRLAESPVFSGGGAPTATAGGTGYAITKASKNTKAAWNLLRNSLITPEGERGLFGALSFNPVLKASYADPYFLDYQDPVLGNQKKFGIYAKIAPGAPAQTLSPHWAQALTTLDNALATVYAGSRTPAQAIKDATATIKQGIQQSS